MSTNHNNGQLTPKENPECASLEKDSKTNTDQKNTQQTNCNCSCGEVNHE
jgi:hypothetical protein